MSTLRSLGTNPRALGTNPRARDPLSRSELTVDELVALSYSDYRRTLHWRRLRRTVRELAEGRCQRCDGRAPLDVHHRTYERRGRELLEDLEALCRTCHRTEHYGEAA
jgi:hypothetical protein